MVGPQESKLPHDPTPSGWRNGSDCRRKKKEGIANWDEEETRLHEISTKKGSLRSLLEDEDNFKGISEARANSTSARFRRCRVFPQTDAWRKPQTLPIYFCAGTFEATLTGNSSGQAGQPHQNHGGPSSRKRVGRQTHHHLRSDEDSRN